MGIVMHSGDVALLPSLRRCLVVGQLSAVFGCILDVSSVLDDVKVVVDKGYTFFNVTQNSEHTSSTRTYEPTSS